MEAVDSVVPALVLNNHYINKGSICRKSRQYMPGVDLTFKKKVDTTFDCNFYLHKL